MRSNVTAKTKSALKSRQVLFVIVAGLVLAATFVLTEQPETRTLRVDSRTFELELALSDKEHEQGLSGRRELPAGKGMLFVFQRENQQCFWMKDMNFPIDIIWTNAHHKIVFLQQNVTPDTYPRTYCPGDPAAYVIELPAGSIAATGMRRGQILNF